MRAGGEGENANTHTQKKKRTMVSIRKDTLKKGKNASS